MPENSDRIPQQAGHVPQAEQLLDVYGAMQNKTMYFAGNSISRGFMFTMGAILKQDAHGIEWEDREHQKMFCPKREDNFPTCFEQIKNTSTLLLNTWTQRFDNLIYDLNRAFKEYRPDYTVVELGLEHLVVEWCVPAGDGKRLWEKSLDTGFEKVAEVIRAYFAERPDAKLVWRPVTHFNELECQNKHLSNALVDEWNGKLLQKLEHYGIKSSHWFIWHTETSVIMDKALARQEGYGLDDWIHPDAHTALQMVVGIARALLG